MAWSPSALRFTLAFVGTLVVAQSVRAEPLVLSAEGQAALAVSAPQSRWFGPGGTLAIAAHYPLTSAFLIGARLRAGLLTGGDRPAEPGVVEPGWGSFELISLMLRVRPLGRSTDERLGTGLFLDLGAGAGVTGTSFRPSVEAGLGYGFGLGALCLAPTVRYLQVIQPDNYPPSDEDARLLLAGVEVSLFDERPRPPPPLAAARKVEVGELPDRDRDGVDDAADGCADTPEDRDSFEDEDGCPDPDNDKDGIEDAQDKCPSDPEDRDGFEDEDGCPELDNDGDDIPDAQDRCPLQAEVVNGIDDYDGCPDEGEIVFKNDRIVLEEQILFDFEFARVRSRAKPVLDAIVRLRQQHPEWGMIQLEGHCDERGPAELNRKLSERRARNVMRKLIEWGIPAEIMSYVGYGSERPLDHGTTEEAYQRNRRVEFVVMTRMPVRKSPALQPSAAPAQAAPVMAEPAVQKALSQPAAAAQHEESGTGTRTGSSVSPVAEPAPARSLLTPQPEGHK
jgi:outer membrane protein OmpA-like peptidoglycan-associated protein